MNRTHRSRRGTTLTEVIVASAIALLVLALLMGFLRNTRVHEARTARRLDHLTVTTRFARTLARDLRAAYVSPAHQPRVGADGHELTFEICRGLPAHPALAPELATVAYAFDAAGKLTRTEAGAATVLGQMPGARVTFALTPESSTVLVRAMLEAGPGLSSRPTVVERVLRGAAATPGGTQWIGPGAPVPASGPETPAD